MAPSLWRSRSQNALVAVLAGQIKALASGCNAATGGINFDAKLRRESTSLVDLFYGHISGMDALARGLRNAAKMLEVSINLMKAAPNVMMPASPRDQAYISFHARGRS